jgi:hypothetical protein
MTDVAPQHEKQIEQMQPKVEGAAEANRKLRSAADASPGATPLEPSGENERLKLSTSGREGGGTAEATVGNALDHGERRPVNSKYANEVYSFESKDAELRNKYPDGVRFDSEGYPDFSPYAAKSVEINMQGNHTSDIENANSAANLAETPDGYTWHHHQNCRTMQLLPSDLHGAVRHTGGVSILEHRKSA